MFRHEFSALMPIVTLTYYYSTIEYDSVKTIGLSLKQ